MQRLNELALEGAEDVDVKRVTEIATSGLTGDREIATALLKRVHQVPFWAYPLDRRMRDCFAPARQVLEIGGDCDNLATLFASTCIHAGIPVQVIWINQSTSQLNHVTTMVYVDGKWRWADPSIKGALIGEDPYSAARRTGNGAPLGIAPAGVAGDSFQWTTPRVVGVGVVALLAGIVIGRATS